MSFSKRPETDADERHAIAVARIHVRLDLEDEAGEAVVGGADDARVARARLRRRRELDERLEEWLEAEIGERAAEKHRGLPARAVFREIVRRAGGADHVQRLAEMRVRLLANELARGRIVERREVHRRAVLPLRFALVQQQVFLVNVVDAAKPVAAADRPVHRRGGDPERALEVVEQLHRIACRTIELVDEGKDRQAVPAAHFEQLSRLIFDAVRRVDHHHDAVGGDERAIRVLAEVLVARCVEQRHAAAFELEFERRRGDRDAALLLERHPVGRRVLACLASPHGTGELDRAGIQQQLLGQRRLAGVGMRDDRERPPSRHLAVELGQRGRVSRSGKLDRLGFGGRGHCFIVQAVVGGKTDGRPRVAQAFTGLPTAGQP